MNKKGYYRIAGIGMYFLMAIIIGSAIWIGTSLFYTHYVDTRADEAVTLSNKLVAVISEKDNLDKIIDREFNVFQEAGLDPEIIKNGDFYLSITIYDKDWKNKLGEVIEGNRDFEVACEFPGEKLFPICYKRRWTYNNRDVNLNLDLYNVEVLTASNQLEREKR